MWTSCRRQIRSIGRSIFDKYLIQTMDSPHKTILITGCAGFIGTNLLIHLLKLPNIKVIGIDNLIVSDAPQISHSNFEFHPWDIVEESDRLSELPKIDEIYHLASIASPAKYKKYPIETLDVNVLGTRNILKFAEKTAPSSCLRPLLKSTGILSSIHNQNPIMEM